MFIDSKIYSVSQITLVIRNDLETQFQDIWVEGEVSNVKIPYSGHIYFILKDSTSQIRGVAFKHKNRFFPFQLQDGMQVLVRGRISVYEARGEYQILVDQIEPRGTGALQLAFEQLKAKLQAEGLFSPEAKKPIPDYPQNIGIITSPTGAAIRDILKVIHRRFANVSIIIYPVRVQGDAAPSEIAQAVRELNKRPEIDVLIIGRGGGSIEDLWAFNEEIVARAIFESRIPTISAVGHEVDFTIADFTADLRAPTPSVAAELVVKNKQDLLDKIDTIQKKLYRSLHYKVQIFFHQLQRCSQSHVFKYPTRLIQDYQQSIDSLEMQLQKGMLNHLAGKKEKTRYLSETLVRLSPKEKIHHMKEKVKGLQEKIILQKIHHLNEKKTQLNILAGKLDSLSPLAILKRGYSVCRKLPNLQVITDAKQLGPKDLITIKLFHGEIISEVIGYGGDEI